MNRDYRMFLTQKLDALQKEISECKKSDIGGKLDDLFLQFDVYLNCLSQYDRSFDK